MIRLLRSPYGVMAVVLAMYVAKVVAKIGIGERVNSPMITGDGYHNVADIFEALLVVATIILARRPQNGNYPFGRKNAESIVAVFIGGGLLVMAGKLLLQSLFGLASWVPGLDRLAGLNPFRHEPLLMGPQFFWWVFGVTAGSVLLSLIVSRYEVSVGKRSGHDSLVADGKETMSDAMIELATLAGVCGEYAFGEARIEYVFTLVVAFKMAQTGREILARGLDVLLQRSIGADHERALRDEVMATHGVTDLAELKTFRAGDKVIVIMKVITRAGTAAQKLMKHAMVARLVKYLRAREFTDGGFFIRFDPPDPQRHRVAYPVTRDGAHATIAKSLDGATHLRVCDIEDGEVVRWKDLALDGGRDAAEALLKEKRVRSLATVPEGASVVPSRHGH